MYPTAEIPSGSIPSGVLLPSRAPAGGASTGGAPPLGTTRKITQRSSVPPSPHRKSARWALKREAETLLPSERVCRCQRVVVAGQIDVVRRPGGGAFFGGLESCGSVWVCPICAAKISERRRGELVDGIKRWTDGGGLALFLTLTFPHRVSDSVTTLLSGFSSARRHLLNSRRWKSLKRRLSIAGTVRALETTFGKNGAHIHSHEIVFCRSSKIGLAEELLSVWQTACQSAGLEIPNGHGVSINDGTYAAQYAGKWGMEHELTKAHMKKGKEGGRTPWDLLRDYSEGDKEAGELFKEYARAFKGKKQLVWSKGLREELGLGKESTDEEVLAAQEEEGEIVCSLSIAEWRSVCANDMRAEILLAAEHGGTDAVLDLLERISPTRTTH